MLCGKLSQKGPCHVEMGQALNEQHSQRQAKMSNRIFTEWDFYAKFSKNKQKTNIFFVDVDDRNLGSETKCPTTNQKVAVLLTPFLQQNITFVLGSFWGFSASWTEATRMKKCSWFATKRMEWLKFYAWLFGKHNLAWIARKLWPS